MGKLFDKVFGFLGFRVEDIDDNDDEMPPSHEPGHRPRNNVVSLQNPRALKMVVTSPATYEQVQAIAEHLKNRRPVILNLEPTDRDEARRILDFISGTVYALNGGMQKVSQSIFVFVPSNVEVSSDDINEPWGTGSSLFRGGNRI